jgi:serralysin
MKAFTLVSILLTTNVGLVFSAPSVVETAYNPATGHNYLLLSTSDWLSAQSAAISLGGNLVTINNQAENDWLFNKWGNTRSLAIGLNDAGHEGTFGWVSGEAFSFSNWYSGEPNNGVGWGTGPENYVYIYSEGYGTPGKWNDYSGGAVLFPQPDIQGVVEVPEPTALGLLCLGGLVLCSKVWKRAWFI